MPNLNSKFLKGFHCPQGLGSAPISAPSRSWKEASHQPYSQHLNSSLPGKKKRRWGEGVFWSEAQVMGALDSHNRDTNFFVSAKYTLLCDIYQVNLKILNYTFSDKKGTLQVL
jgi:hypothetical protein